MTSTILREEFERRLLIRLYRRGLVEIAIAVTIIVILTLPQFDYYFDSNLVMHLSIQHTLLIVGGFLFAQGLDRLILVLGAVKQPVAETYSELLRLNVRFNRRGILTFAAGTLLVAYWHLPSSFNAALTKEFAHAEMHLTLIIAGSLFFVGFKLLTPNMRIFTYILGCKAMAIFGAYLVVSPVVIYGSFPYPAQAEAGVAMVAMCMASDATIVPLWLRRVFKQHQ